MQLLSAWHLGNLGSLVFHFTKLPKLLNLLYVNLLEVDVEQLLGGDE